MLLDAHSVKRASAGITPALVFFISGDPATVSSSVRSGSAVGVALALRRQPATVAFLINAGA